MKSRLHRMTPFALLLGMALFAGLGAGSTLAKDKPADITGTWKITGWNAGGDRTGPPAYTGIVEVQQKSEKGCYALTWIVGQAKSKQPGIAVYDPQSGALAAAYVAGGKAGVVLLRPDATGKKLEGLWSMKGMLAQAPGLEDWSR